MLRTDTSGETWEKKALQFFMILIEREKDRDSGLILCNSDILYHYYINPGFLLNQY